MILEVVAGVVCLVVVVVARRWTIRDLIGGRRFTQDHYATLTGPWRKVFGPIHPDDEDLR